MDVTVWLELCFYEQTQTVTNSGQLAISKLDSWLLVFLHFIAILTFICYNNNAP